MTMPLNLLEKTINRRVAVLLKDGRTLDGKLVGFDEHMNIVLEETEEIAKEGSPDGVTSKRLGTIILRGNNVIRIAPK